jgi:hypothetical protein
MKKIVSFLVIIFSPVISYAEFALEHLTRAEGVYIIDSITHSNNRHVKNSFSSENDMLLLFSETHVEDPAHPGNRTIYYKKYYHENGKLQREGLSCGRDIGIWSYYDTTGFLFKEFDFSTNKRTLFGMEKEPLDWVFDSVICLAEQFAIRHYGKDFYKKYIVLSKTVSWSTARYFPYGNCLPNTPAKPAKEYSVYMGAVFNDSVSGADISVNFDSLLHITWVSYLRDTANFFPKINVSYASALRIAKENGFYDVSLGDWDEDIKAYSWYSSITFSSEGDDWHSRTHGKCLRINSQTGKYSIKYCDGGFDADGFISDFQKEWTDTVKTPADHKQISFSNATLDFPMDWILTENYHYKTYEDSYYMTHGTDTLRMNEYCGSFEEYYNPDRPVEDEASERAFLSYFKDSTVQGRKMEIKIIQMKNDRYSIKYSITESGVAFNCGPIVYEFKATASSAAGRDELLTILKTVRFRTY